MTLFEQFTAATTTGATLTDEDIRRCESICQRVRGYSDGKHYAFFKTLLSLPMVRDVLILGVYHGRDMAFILDCAKTFASREPLILLGVDKFSDTACADWPQHKRNLNWRDAGFGEPPDEHTAKLNIMDAVGSLPESINWTTVARDDEEFMANVGDYRADVIYLDTSHDYETVMRQLRQVRRVCRRGAIICGDDLSDQGTWGVKRAVTESFSEFKVFAEWIWVSGLEHLKP